MEETKTFNNVYGYFAEFVNKLALVNLKKLNEKKLQKSFDIYKTSLLNYFGIPSDIVKLVKKNELYSLSVNNKIVPEKRLKKALEWLQYNGIIIEYLKNLGFPQNVLDSDTVKQRNASFINNYDEKYEGLHLFTKTKIRMQVSKKVNKVIGGDLIKTATDLTNVLQNNLWLSKQFDVFLTSFYIVKDVTMGDWVKTPSPKNVNINSLFDAIKNHQNTIIPGCWAIKYDKDDRCLAKDLSCGDEIKTNVKLCSLNCKNCCKDQKNCEIVCSNTSGSIMVPADTILICIKSTFWFAAQDYMNIYFDIPKTETTNDNNDDADEAPDDDEAPDTDNFPLRATSSDMKWVWIVIAVVAFLWMIYLIYSKAYRGTKP